MLTGRGPGVWTEEGGVRQTFQVSKQYKTQYDHTGNTFYFSFSCKYKLGYSG